MLCSNRGLAFILFGLIYFSFIDSFSASMNETFKLSENEIVLLKERVKDDDIEAAKRLANHYNYIENNYDEAILYLECAARLGDAISQNNLAVLLMASPEKEKQRKSIVWLERAASGGNANAQQSLAFLYEKGEIIARDYCKALELYEQIAQDGDLAAMVKVATFYQEGKCGNVDLIQACKWWDKASTLAQPGSISAQLIESKKNNICKSITHPPLAR